MDKHTDVNGTCSAQYQPVQGCNSEEVRPVSPRVLKYRKSLLALSGTIGCNISFSNLADFNTVLIDAIECELLQCFDDLGKTQEKLETLFAFYYLGKEHEKKINKESKPIPPVSNICSYEFCTESTETKEPKPIVDPRIAIFDDYVMDLAVGMFKLIDEDDTEKFGQLIRTTIKTEGWHPNHSFSLIANKLAGM
ncbi:MAG TPA: hypothetical protein VEQ18_02685, partial [Candidatus Nitrosocosmicus sp.]|nr:hypothetical protein [Candidatus Nitrosocosmicus sp.]